MPSSNPYRAPDPSVSLDLPSAGLVPRAGYRSTSVLTQATVLALVANAFLELALLPRMVAILSPVLSPLEPPEWAQTAWFPSRLDAIVVMALGWVLVPAWFHRSYRNLRAFGVETRHTPAWAVACFFVPVVNIVLPHRIAREIWVESSDDRSTGHDPPSPVWWAAYVGAHATGLATRLAPLPLVALAAAGLVVMVLRVVSALATIHLVREISHRQAARRAVMTGSAAPARSRA